MSNDSRMTDEEIAKSLGIPVSNLKLGKEAKKRQAADRLRKLQETADMESKKLGMTVTADDIIKRNEARFEAEKVNRAKQLEAFRQGKDMQTSAPSTKKGGGATSGQKLAAASQFAKSTGMLSSGETDVQGGAAEGALSGAAAGSAFGAPGAIVGGLIGGLTGGMRAKAARKRQLAEIESKKYKKLGEIEQEKGARIQSALAGLRQSFQASLLQQNELRLF